MNVKLLNKVMAEISAEPRRLEMCVFGELVDPTGDDAPPCGTTACIAGWSMILSGKYKLTAKGFPYDDTQAIEVLDITKAQAANLRDANLRDADLRGADLSGVRGDFFDVLLRVPHEIAGLKLALKEGRVDGSTYEGECACLVGTIAKVKECGYTQIPNLKPDSNRPIERFFMAIRKGDTPENNSAAKIAYDWIEEFEGFLAAAKESVTA